MLEIFLNKDKISVNDLIYYNQLIGKEVIVINIYREPIERKISDFFEKISLHFNTSKKNINKIPIDKIIKRFNSILPFIDNDDKFLNKYNINLPLPLLFDFKNKYNIVIQNNIKYVTLRLKDSKFWSTILTEILKHKIIIIKDYETINKSFSQIYYQFNSTYKLPENYLLTIEQDTDLSFYLSEQERLSYISNWENNKTNIYKSFTQEEYIFYSTICSENNIEDKIESMHYKDEGCLCKVCYLNREHLQNIILDNKYKGETNYHNDNITKYNNKKKELFNKLIKYKNTNIFHKLNIL